MLTRNGTRTLSLHVRTYFVCHTSYAFPRPRLHFNGGRRIINPLKGRNTYCVSLKPRTYAYPIMLLASFPQKHTSQKNPFHDFFLFGVDVN